MENEIYLNKSHGYYEPVYAIYKIAYNKGLMASSDDELLLLIIDVMIEWYQNIENKEKILQDIRFVGEKNKDNLINRIVMCVESMIKSQGNMGNNILFSIGCGNGLKEQLIMNKLKKRGIGISMVGVEINNTRNNNYDESFLDGSKIICIDNRDICYDQLIEEYVGENSHVLGFFNMSAHHTLNSIGELLAKLKRCDYGVLFIEELIEDGCWANYEYRLLRYCIEALVNFSYEYWWIKKDDMYDFFKAKYYTIKDVEDSGGEIVYVDKYGFPAISYIVI